MESEYCFNAVNGLTIETLVLRAFLLFKIFASIATPCSVKAKGRADLGRLEFNVITNCDDIVSHSFFCQFEHKV